MFKFSLQTFDFCLQYGSSPHKVFVLDGFVADLLGSVTKLERREGLSKRAAETFVIAHSMYYLVQPYWVEGLMAAINDVRVLPPNESRSRKVSLLSR